MSEHDFGTVGVRAGATHSPREILLATEGARYLPGGRVIDGVRSRDTANTGDTDVLRPGTLLGRVTSSGKYASAIIGVTGVLHDTSVVTTTMTLPAAVVAELARRIGASGTFKVVGPPTSAGTVAIETVTYAAIASATTITITATAADFAAGSLIMPVDGSETIRGLLDGFVKVTDVDGTNRDTRLPRLLIGGLVRSSAIVHWPSDSSVQTWIKQQLNQPATACGPFNFDDNF